MYSFGGADAGEAAASRDLAVLLATAARRGDRNGERGACVLERGARHVHALVREAARGPYASLAATSRYALLCSRSTSFPGCFRHDSILRLGEACSVVYYLYALMSI